MPVFVSRGKGEKRKRLNALSAVLNKGERCSRVLSAPNETEGEEEGEVSDDEN